METNNEFNEFISIISVPIAFLLEELENGGKVSNLLDNKENLSIGSIQEVNQ